MHSIKPTLLIITSSECQACVKFRLDHLNKLRELLEIGESREGLIFGQIRIDNFSPTTGPSWESAIIPPIKNRGISLGYVPSFYLVNTVQLFAQEENINILSLYAPDVNKAEDLNYIQTHILSTPTADSIYAWILANHSNPELISSGPIKLVIKPEKREKRSKYVRRK